MTEIITGRQWDLLARRLERANLRMSGTSLTAGSIARAAYPYIVEERPDGTLEVRQGWREAMKQRARSFVEHPETVTPDRAMKESQ